VAPSPGEGIVIIAMLDLREREKLFGEKIIKRDLRAVRSFKEEFSQKLALIAADVALRSMTSRYSRITGF
jgi:hypothetical protein